MKTKDLDRNIVTIKYNLLNLPEIIQFKNGNQIRNKYNATGQKLSSRNITVEAGVYQPLNPGDFIENPDVNENDNVIVEGMDHIGNMEYYSGRYFDRGSTTHAAATVQRTQYYPSGLPWKYNSGDNPGSQPYKYNGKEFVEMHGLDECGYMFRNYQPKNNHVLKSILFNMVQRNIQHLT